MKLLKESLKRGIITQNPTFVQVLGMCPTLAVTTSIANGLGMGLSATLVLMFSNLFISLLRKFIPQRVRIAAYIVVIASFVTVVQLLLQAYIPGLYKSLGIFIPLIVVNCIILARAEAFASKNTPLPSLLDGLGMGLGFTVSLTVSWQCVRHRHHHTASGRIPHFGNTPCNRNGNNTKGRCLSDAYGTFYDLAHGDIG